MRIKKHIPFIQKFCNKCSAKNRNNLLRKASPSEILSLCECVLNVYKGHVPIEPKTLRRLRIYKKDLLHLLTRKSKVDTKRKRLIQKGGFLPLIASSVIPFLISTIFDGAKI